ncbi:unnamed protein product [Rhodiola kirilowii]
MYMQSNFAPVEELNELHMITSIEGHIPDDFTEGVYIRNGSNPLFGGFKVIEIDSRTSKPHLDRRRRDASCNLLQQKE